MLKNPGMLQLFRPRAGQLSKHKEIQEDAQDHEHADRHADKQLFVIVRIHPNTSLIKLV
jgi:hypothetical protein